MFMRAAKAVALADKDYMSAKELKEVEKEFYDMMQNLEFLPTSNTYECWKT